jgi:hypothetical protein
VASLLPLHNFYSILIRLLKLSSREAGETWVKNMVAEFCLKSIFIITIIILLMFSRTKLIAMPSLTQLVFVCPQAK